MSTGGAGVADWGQGEEQEQEGEPWNIEIDAFGEDEPAGSQRALQQWLMKLDYNGMQQKHELQSIRASLERSQKAMTNAERRQDREACSPED